MSVGRELLAGAALAQQVPALVELFFDLLEPRLLGAVERVAPFALAFSEAQFLADEFFDASENLFVLHAPDATQLSRVIIPAWC